MMNEKVLKKVSGIFRTRKLRFDIVTGFTVIMLITATSIMWYTYTNNTKNLREFSNTLLKNIETRIIHDTDNFFDAAHNSSVLAGSLITKPEAIRDTNEALILYMMGVMKAYPQISLTYAGSEAGDFLQVARLEPGATYRSHPTDPLPGGLQYAVRFINRSQGPESETWQYRDENGEIQETEIITSVFYNHKTRSWYAGARQSRKFFWSDVYVFVFNKKLGITAAQPLYKGLQTAAKGEFIGVIGVDIQVSDLEVFLKQASLGKDSTVFIVNADNGELVAFPDIRKAVSETEDPNTVPFIHDLKDKKFSAAFQQRVNSGEENFIFEHNSISYFASFAPFAEKFSKKWEVGIVAPTDIFLGGAKKIQQQTIIMSLLIFAISIFFILLLARNLSRPIVQLSKEAIKIKEFELDKGKEVQSNVYEIQLLNDSISSMRHSLQAFGKFVPKNIVKRLTQKNLDVRVGGKSRELTLLFTDIANFTTVSESYPPEKLMPHLSEYFEVLTTIIQRQHGTVDKYIGDAIMAFWGAPEVDRMHALHACIAALMCQKTLLGLNRKWRAENKPELRTRIGIHTGEAIVGNVGSSDRVNYTALGDPVNLASRLEGVNKMYNTYIIISEDVHERVQKDCVVRPLDVVAVKGKTKGVMIYELVGLKEGNPDLFPSRDEIEFAKMFTEAFKVYLEKRWDEAIEDFKKIMKQFGDDQVSDMYIKRCKAFKENPPPQDWDGVVHLKTK